MSADTVTGCRRYAGTGKPFPVGCASNTVVCEEEGRFPERFPGAGDLLLSKSPLRPYNELQPNASQR